MKFIHKHKGIQAYQVHNGNIFDCETKSFVRLLKGALKTIRIALFCKMHN